MILALLKESNLAELKERPELESTGASMKPAIGIFFDISIFVAAGTSVKAFDRVHTSSNKSFLYSPAIAVISKSIALFRPRSDNSFLRLSCLVSFMIA